MAMVVRTNLATIPHTNRRLLSLGLVTVTLLCGALSIRFVEVLGISENRSQAAQEQVRIQKQQIADLQKQLPAPIKPEQLLAADRELLTAAAVLIEQRVFPWSQLLRDLETRLDNDVRLTRVNVGLEDRSKVNPSEPGTAPMQISMVLIGKQLDNVLESLERLRSSGRFSPAQLQKQSPVEGTQEVEYEVEMTYHP